MLMSLVLILAYSCHPAPAPRELLSDQDKEGRRAKLPVHPIPHAVLDLPRSHRRHSPNPASAHHLINRDRSDVAPRIIQPSCLLISCPSLSSTTDAPRIAGSRLSHSTATRTSPASTVRGTGTSFSRRKVPLPVRTGSMRAFGRRRRVIRCCVAGIAILSELSSLFEGEQRGREPRGGRPRPG